jgi:hypothetical protein
MSWWMNRAAEFQQSVRHGEITKVHEYADGEVRQAIALAIDHRPVPNSIHALLPIPGVTVARP